MIKAVEPCDFIRCAEVIRDSFMTVANEFGFTEENAPRFTAFAVNAGWLDYQYNTEHRPMFAYYDGNGNICGYYSLQDMGNKEWELNHLSVLPGHRHNGIGGKLLRHAIETAGLKGGIVLKIGIVEENTLLRKWYEDAGFVHTGTKKYDHFPFTCGYMELAL